MKSPGCRLLVPVFACLLTVSALAAERNNCLPPAFKCSAGDDATQDACWRSAAVGLSKALTRRMAKPLANATAGSVRKVSSSDEMLCSLTYYKKIKQVSGKMKSVINCDSEGAEVCETVKKFDTLRVGYVAYRIHHDMLFGCAIDGNPDCPARSVEDILDDAGEAIKASAEKESTEGDDVWKSIWERASARVKASKGAGDEIDETQILIRRK